MRNVTVTITIPETSGTGEQHAAVIKELLAPHGYEDAVVEAGGIPSKQAVLPLVDTPDVKPPYEYAPDVCSVQDYRDFFGDEPPAGFEGYAS